MCVTKERFTFGIHDICICSMYIYAGARPSVRGPLYHLRQIVMCYQNRENHWKCCLFSYIQYTMMEQSRKSYEKHICVNHRDMSKHFRTIL